MTRALGLEEAAPAEFLFDGDEEADAPTEYLFDINDLERMCEVGVFKSVNDRVELIDGKVMLMAPASGGHAYSTGGLSELLTMGMRATDHFAGLRTLNSGTLLISPRNAVEPDCMVVRGRSREKYYTPNELVFLAEVSVSSRRYDLTSKMTKYATAALPEYWVLDHKNKCVHVFRSPSGDGYAEEIVASGDDRVEPLFSEGRISIRAGDLF